MLILEREKNNMQEKTPKFKKDYTGLKVNFVEIKSFHSVQEFKVKSTGKTSNIFRWNALCTNCGKEFIVTSKFLASNIMSCGCYRKECDKRFAKNFAGANKLPDGTSGFNILYNEYKRSAERRDLKFNIDIDKFKELTKSDCHYCGELPTKISFDSNTLKTTGYIYNGLDRVDSKKDYTEDNVVPCCSDCNYAKRSRGYKEYINHVIKSAKYLIDNGK